MNIARIRSGRFLQAAEKQRHDAAQQDNQYRRIIKDAHSRRFIISLLGSALR